VRIDKFLAHTGFGTRAEVKKLLKLKAVKVDNQVVRDGKIKINPQTQVVTVYDETAVYREYVYFMMNKPQNYLSATSDRQYQTVIDLLAEKDRLLDVVPAGRLDRDTEGLMLLTNDGKLVHDIISPKKDIYKRYLVHLTGELTQDSVKKLEQGIEILDGKNETFMTKPAKVKIIDKKANLTRVEIEITEGKFHQVKRMFAHIGCKVVYLKRLAIGNLVLDESLSLGAYRELMDSELETLKIGKD